MIYFDNAATTRPSSAILEKAKIFNEQYYFNPSALYVDGLKVEREIKNAKQNILKCLGTTNHEVIFTSCGSESDNQAIFCSVRRGVFLTTKGEHSAVYQSFLELKNRGLKVEFVDVNSDGSVNVEKLLNFVENNQVDFISLIHVNNETGAINDVNSIAKQIKLINNKIILHVDGVQAFGKIPFVLSKDIDLYSISAHKINALKGTGALIKKKGVNLFPLIFGGGQETGLRSGTENVFGIKVFEYASCEKYSNIQENFDKVKQIKNYIHSNLDNTLFTIISSENSSPYILSVSVKGVRGEIIMHALENENIIVGNGSACSSKNRYSRVIKACGYDNQILDGVVRISFSSENTMDEAVTFVNVINQLVKKLKGKLN